MKNWRVKIFVLFALLPGAGLWLTGCASGPTAPSELPLDMGSSVGLRLDGQETQPALILASRDRLHLGLTVSRGQGLRYEVTTVKGASTECRGRLQQGRVERCGPLPGGDYRIVVESTPRRVGDSGIWLWASAWNERSSHGNLHLRKQFIVPALVGAFSMR